MLHPNMAVCHTGYIAKTFTSNYIFSNQLQQHASTGQQKH